MGTKYNRTICLSTLRFHSIDFPSEWGLEGAAYKEYWLEVSIQLISPASGDPPSRLSALRLSSSVSIQLISPASGDNKQAKTNIMTRSERFHSIDFPSEWGLLITLRASLQLIEFPFN